MTILVTQRERFSATAESLQSLLEHTQSPFRLIYVDTGSPPHIQSYLREQALANGFDLIRRDRYATQNEARNLALSRVTTRYVCFVDNDLIAFPGWLDRLLSCAEETDAAIVGPLYGIHTIADGHRVHTTTGLFRVSERGRRRSFSYRLQDEGRSLDDPGLVRERRPCEQVEFHCMLVRTAALAPLHGVDEGIRGGLDHVDLCLAVAELGGTIWTEPAAVVSYLQPPPVEWSDLSFFMCRWSEAANAASCRHFARKWKVHSRYDHRIWVREHRSLSYHWVPDALIRLVGKRAAIAILAGTVFPAESMLNRLGTAIVERRQRHRPDGALRMPARA